MMNASDEQLVLRMASRDEAALAELYKRYAPYLAALSRRMLHDRDEAQSCVQDAFVRAWEASERFDPERASAKTWLVTIGRRVALNQLRGKSLATLPLEAWDGPTPAADLLPRIELDAAMSQLEGDERELIERAFYQGHSHQELADLTGRPLGSVKTKLRTALQKLRGALTEPRAPKGRPERGGEQ
jgi:RNA polymerase sigma-70 factor (ECF subfamily)